MRPPRHVQRRGLWLFALVSTISVAACTVGPASPGPAAGEGGASTQPTTSAG